MNDLKMARELVRISRILVGTSESEKKKMIGQVSRELQNLFNNYDMEFNRDAVNRIYEAIDSGKPSRLEVGYLRDYSGGGYSRGYSDSASFRDRPVTVIIRPADPDKVWDYRYGRVEVEYGSAPMRWIE